MNLEIKSKNQSSVDVKKNPVRGELREIKRREYKPDKIKVLFACESLPKDIDNFFYYKHSVLFNHTLTAFQRVFPKITQANFLEKFKELGFYLDDLCGEPVNHLKDDDDKIKRIRLRELYEEDFAKRISIYRPNFIIITPNGIKENINSSLQKAGLDIPYKDLPFPVGSGRNSNNYVNGLEVILLSLVDQKLIND